MRARILLALAALIALPFAAFAKIVTVYSLTGARPSTEDARHLIGILNDPATAGDAAAFAADKGLGYKVGEGNTFTAGMVAPNQAYGYYWSDGPAKFGPGFKPAGGRFENPGSGGKSIAGKPALAPTGKALGNAFSAQVVPGQGLRVSYSLAKAGPVSVSVFGANGRSLGQWKWTEAAPGTYSKELNFQGAGQGKVLVRYKVGALRAVQRVTLDGR